MPGLAKQTMLIEDIFSSKLLQAIGGGMDVSGSLTKRRKLVLELMTRIAKMQQRLQSEFNLVVPLTFELHESLWKCLKFFRIVEEGSMFSSFIGKIKLKAMLESEIDSKKVSHISKQHRTLAHKFTTSFKRKIEAKDESMRINVNKNTSTELIRVIHQDGRMLFVDSGAVKAGKRCTMLLKQGETATLEYPCYPQILQYSGHIKTRYDEVLPRTSEFTKLEKSTQAAPVEVHAMHHAFTMVGGDGSIWHAGFRANGTGRE